MAGHENMHTVEPPTLGPVILSTLSSSTGDRDECPLLGICVTGFAPVFRLFKRGFHQGGQYYVFTWQLHV